MPGPGVAHRDPRTAGHPLGLDLHRTPGRRVARRVREQVGEHLRQRIRIDIHGARTRQPDGDLDAVAPETRLRELDRRAHVRREVQPHGSQRAARVALRERVQRARQPRQPCGLLQQRVECDRSAGSTPSRIASR